MDGRAQQPTDGEAGTRIAVAVAERGEIQASPPVYEDPDADTLSQELRARLIAAALELAADGVSDPRLGGTRHSPAAP